MEVFILLVLSVGLCQAGPVQDDVSCDDPEVFEAVARAITELNEDRTQGNKFALSLILHAHRIAGPRKKFHVIYQVRETACPIAAKEPWQNCDFLEISEDYGNCTADIDIDSQGLISQYCKFSPGLENVIRSTAHCLGCWHPIDPKSLEVLPIVRFTIRQFNNQSQQSALYEVREMKTATRQVVNGWNYNLEYSIKETNCSKNEFLDLSPACRHLPEGKEGFCTVTAYIDNANTLVHAQQDCKVQVEEKVGPPVHLCPGCPVAIARDSPELEEPLQNLIESFNANNNGDFHFRIVGIKDATKQVVAGTKYRINFTIQQTNCSKAEVEKLSEDCTPAKAGEWFLCHGSVHITLWEPFSKPEVTCSEAQISEIPPDILLRVPPGFTPFRNTDTTQTEGPNVVKKFHPEPRGRHTHEKKQSFGRANKHRQGHRHRHKKPTESSSEEVIVLPPVETPSQLPTSKAFLEQEANSRSPHEERVGFSDVSPVHGSSTDSPIFSHQLPDLPEPPKCPGTPWKPIRDPEPVDTVFSDLDLLDALLD
ncbi:kininogen-1-like [Notechis scutatus]|uniref:Kininogen-1-like n=1 Tax=Notechis scutatus TaxID=8663 RepID=A0A6J1V8K8_9SAUR|nr:kininogen-1-like [Notechis scutatus]